MRMIAGAALIAGATLMLSACGETPGTRAVTGGVLGAGTGAAVSGISGGHAGTGALIGGGIGALGGAVTAPRHY
ncbi:MAG: hypothetical protein ACRYHQ_27835 [Janthinobacterium lividum]